MINFYCIDGPLKGSFIKSDFKPTERTDGQTYYKKTFVIRSPLPMYTDIATINKDLTTLNVNDTIPFYFRMPFELKEQAP